MRTLAIAFVIGLIPSAAMAAKYKVQDVDNGGAIQGIVKLSGTAPSPEMVAIAKDNEVCGTGEIPRNPIKVGADGSLQNVVVYLEKVKSGKAWLDQDYSLNQLKCAFDPYLQVIPKGAELTIKNSDPVLHNVHPYEHVKDKRRTLFNLAQPKLDQVNVKKIKTRKGQIVEIACDAHSWMAGWLFVMQHPYFAVVDQSGAFSIGDVPPGKYTLKAWHPVLQFQETKVEVGPGGALDVVLDFGASS